MTHGVRAGVAIAVAAVALTGCGGADSGGRTATTTAATTTTNHPTEADAASTAQQTPVADNPTLGQLRTAVNAGGGDCSAASWRKVSAAAMPSGFSELAWCEKGTLAIATTADDFGGDGFLAMRKLAREKAAADGVALSVEAGDGLVIAGTKAKLKQLRPVFSESIIG